jgi:hypothetical protein
MNQALREAMRARFGTPQAAMKALGLDARLLDAGTGSAERERLRLDSDRLNRQRSAFKEHETFGVDRGGGGMRSRTMRRVRRAVFDDGGELSPDQIALVNRILCGEGEDGDLPVEREDVEYRQGSEDRRRRAYDQPEYFRGVPRTEEPTGPRWHESGRDWREAEDRRMAQDVRPRNVVHFTEAYPAAARIRLTGT